MPGEGTCTGTRCPRARCRSMASGDPQPAHKVITCEILEEADRRMLHDTTARLG